MGMTRSALGIATLCLLAQPFLLLSQPSCGQDPAVPPPATPPAPAAPLPPLQRPELAKVSAERLARTMTTLAGKSIRKDQISAADLELSLALAQNAVDLDPTNVWAWRALYWIASANDPADPAIQALRVRALDQIVKLDRGDEVMRLRRLVDLIEREETAEARIEKYTAVLAKENIGMLGKSVAARLALDLALLLRRTGDQAGFEKWLAEAVTLDPAFPAAATMAAGYFRFATEDPAKEAELLVAAMMANPLDRLAIRALAALLLQKGAYVGASRFMGICARMEHTEYPLIAYDDLLSEQVLAQLANREFEAVDLAVRTRQKELNDYVQLEVTRADPSILGDAKRLASQNLPVQQQQAAIRLAALRSIGDAARIEEARTALFASLDAAIQRAARERENAKDDDERQAATSIEAATMLEAVFLGIWIGEDVERSRAYLTDVDAKVPVSDVAKRRFEAYATLRAGDAAKALAMFEEANENSALGKLGRALALEATGNKRDAAKELLAVWRAEPASLVGLDAKRRLELMLGAEVPLDAEASRVEAVVAAIPPSFDRMFTQNARVLRMRIRRGDVPRNAFDPMPISVEITNESPIALSIDPAGPLRDLMSAEMTVVASGQSSSIDLPPYMINIAREFSIGPRETLAIPFDIAYSDAGAYTTNTAAKGCGITMHAIANWEPSAGGVRPGLFGDDAELGLLRVEGAPATPEWIDATLAVISDPTTDEDLFDIVAAAYMAADAERRPEAVPPEIRERLAKVLPALGALLPRLDPVTQAWFVTVLPDSTPSLDAALEPIRVSNDRLTRLMYLVRRATRSADPVVDAAIRSDDPALARYGRLVKDMLFNEEERLRRDFNLSGGSGAPGAEPGTKPESPVDSRSSSPSTPPPSAPGAADPTTPPPAPKP
jgi:hypothetical protein